MSLQSLPTEIRLEIYSYLRDFSYGRQETICPKVRLTPAICRVSQQLREEALPLYAKTSSFIIQTDDDKRIQGWLQALRGTALSKVENLQLSKNWKIKLPTRGLGHVGFYVRMQMINRIWKCTVGTYPIANDMREMRLESVNLLRRVVVQRLRPSCTCQEMKQLTREDVEFVDAAMAVVAYHPMPTFDTPQSEAGREQRRAFFLMLERELLALQNRMKLTNAAACCSGTGSSHDSFDGYL